MILKKLFILLIIFNMQLLALNKQFLHEDMSAKVNITDKSFTLELDLGLGENVLQDLQDIFLSQLNNFFNPIILDLKEIQEENIKNLNFTESPMTGVTNQFMSMLGIKDGTFLKNKQCDGKNESSYCDYANKNEYFGFSQLNPFNEIRIEIENQHKELVDQVKAVGSNIKNQMNTAWDKAFKEFQIDGPLDDFMEMVFDNEILTDYLMEEMQKHTFFKNKSIESEAIMSLLSNPNKSASQIGKEYAEKTNPNLFDYNNIKSSFGVKVNDKPKITNNLCDLVMDMFDKNSALQDKINERISEFRKELYKYIMYKVVEELTKNLEIITLIQHVQKMTQCSIEATIAAANTDSEGKAIFSSLTSNALTAISAATKAAKQKNAKANTANDSDKNEKSKTVQNCLEETEQKNKKEVNTQSKIGLANKGQLSFPLANLWTYIPFVNLAAGIKGKTTFTEDQKTLQNLDRCVQEGKTSTWQAAYKSCLMGNSGLEFKIDSKLKKQIAKLFKTVRKNKKRNCEELEKAAKRNTYNFGKLKIAFKPSPAVGPYVDNGTFKYFTGFVFKLVQAQIETPKDKSPEIALFYQELESIRANEKYESEDSNGTILPTRKFKTMQDFIDCGGIDTVNGGPYSCSMPNTVGLRNFCSYQVDELVRYHKFQEIIKKTTKDSKKETPEFGSIITNKLANIYHCTNILKDIIDKPVIQKIDIQYKEPTDLTKGSLSYLIDKKWLLENNQITLNEYNKNIVIEKGAREKFKVLSKEEKIQICVNSNKNEDLLNTSIMYQLCKEFKISIFKETFSNALNQFKTVNIDNEEVTNAELLNIKVEKEKFIKQFELNN